MLLFDYTVTSPSTKIKQILRGFWSKFPMLTHPNPATKKAAKSPSFNMHAVTYKKSHQKGFCRRGNREKGQTLVFSGRKISVFF